MNIIRVLTPLFCVLLSSCGMFNSMVGTDMNGYSDDIDFAQQQYDIDNFKMSPAAYKASEARARVSVRRVENTEHAKKLRSIHEETRMKRAANEDEAEKADEDTIQLKNTKDEIMENTKMNNTEGPVMDDDDYPYY